MTAQYKKMPDLPSIAGYEWHDARRPDGPELAHLRAIETGELRGICREAKLFYWQRTDRIEWAIVAGRTLSGKMQFSQTFSDPIDFAATIR